MEALKEALEALGAMMCTPTVSHVVAVEMFVATRTCGWRDPR